MFARAGGGGDGEQPEPAGDFPWDEEVEPWVVERDSYVMKEIMAERALGNGPGKLQQNGVAEHVLTQYLCARRREFFPRHSFLYDWEWRAGDSALNFNGDLLLWNGDERAPTFLAVETKIADSVTGRKKGGSKAKVDRQARVAAIFAHSYLSDVFYQRCRFRENSNVSRNNCEHAEDDLGGDQQHEQYEDFGRTSVSDEVECFGGRIAIIHGVRLCAHGKVRGGSAGPGEGTDRARSVCVFRAARACGAGALHRQILQQPLPRPHQNAAWPPRRGLPAVPGRAQALHQPPR